MNPRNKSWQKELDDKVAAIAAGHRIWDNFAVKKRAARIKKLRRVIARRAWEISQAISEECHRPAVESLTQEVLPALEFCRYCETHFPKWLAMEKFRYWRPGFWRKQNYMIYQSIGPFCIMTPANFPFSLALMSSVYALMAGNTVLIKPSEHSRIIAPLIDELFQDAELSPAFANTVQGDVDTGKILVGHPQIKKVVFFGRRYTGEQVFARCAALRKPCVLELSGSSTAIVDEDADLELAAAGLAWSGFYANDQSCIGTDRIFVHKKIAGPFLQHLIKAVKDSNSQMQPAVIDQATKSDLQKLIKAALKEGCQILHGNTITHIEKDLYHFENTILYAPDPQRQIFQKELYGPLIIVCQVENVEIIIPLINRDFPSLGASLWMKERKRAINLAKQIDVGMIWLNDASFGLPCLPWFGRSETGWGSLFSKHSLHEVLQLKWLSRHPSHFTGKRIWWYPYTSMKESIFRYAAKIFRIW